MKQSLLMPFGICCLCLVSAEAQEQTKASGQKEGVRYHFLAPDALLEEAIQKSRINTQEVCPFGFSQESTGEGGGSEGADNLPINAIVEEELEQEQTPLLQVVNAIPVSWIDAQRQTFSSKGRFFSRGSLIPVQYQSTSYQLKVLNVSNKRIVFKNESTGEQVFRRVGIRPFRKIPQKQREIESFQQRPLVLEPNKNK